MARPDWSLMSPLAKKIYEKTLEDSFQRFCRSVQTSQAQPGESMTIRIEDMPRHYFPFEDRARFDPLMKTRVSEVMLYTKSVLDRPFPEVRAETKPPCAEPDPNGILDWSHALDRHPPLGKCARCERLVWPVEVLEQSGVGYTLMEYLKLKNPRGFHEGDFPKGWPEGKEINWEIE